MSTMQVFKIFNKIVWEDWCIQCNDCKTIFIQEIFTHDDEQNYCAACSAKKGKGIRNKALEAVLSNCYYLCPNRNCYVWSKWADMPGHRKTCVDQSIQCNFCRKEIELHNISRHLICKHTDECCYIITTEPYVIIDITRSSDKVKYYLVQYKTHMFLVSIHMESDNISFSIAKSWCPLNEAEETFHVKIACGDRIVHMQGDYSTIQELYRNQCSKQSVFAEDWRDARVEVKFGNLHQVSQLAECPICMDTLTAEVAVCVNMHPVCSSCSGKLQSCASCREPMNKTKLKLYNIMPDLRVQCRYASDGCLKVARAEEVEEHERICGHRLVACVECNLQVLVIGIIEHFRTMHNADGLDTVYRCMNFERYFVGDGQLFKMICAENIHGTYGIKVERCDCFDAKKHAKIYGFQVYTVSGALMCDSGTKEGKPFVRDMVDNEDFFVIMYL